MNGRAGSTDEPLSDGRHAGRFLLAGLLVLAIGATTIMVLSDSTQWLRIGVLAALWAALIGGLVAAKYRGQVAERRGEVADMQELYELELEREVAARREYELELEADARNQAVDEQSKQLEALREEMRVLRENLEALVGGEVLVERVALRAESTRMRSLQDNSGRARGVDNQRQRTLSPGQVVEGGPAERPRRQERPVAPPPPPPPPAERTTRSEPVSPPAARRQEPQKRKPAAPPTEQQRRVQHPPGPPREQPPRNQPPPPQRPPERPPERPSERELAETDWWAASEFDKPPEPSKPAVPRKEPELPRRQPGASRQQRPGWAKDTPDLPKDQQVTKITEGLDPNWTPSWEADRAAEHANGTPVEQTSNGDGGVAPGVPPIGREPRPDQPPAPSREPARRSEPAPPPEPAPERQPVFNGYSDPERSSAIPPDERPPAGRTARRHGRPDDEDAGLNLPETRHMAPPSGGGGRRRKPDPEDAPATGGRRRKPEPDESGGRRRKPEEYADPDAGGGWTIRSQNGSSNGHGGHRNSADRHDDYRNAEEEDPGAHAEGRAVSDLLASYGDSGGGRRRKRED